MQALRRTIHIILVLAILSTGMPFYHPGDANRDGEVGLADAILRVRDFARTADNPGAFRDGVEDVLITIAAVAGFKKVIKSDREQGSQGNSFSAPVLSVVAGQYPEKLPLMAASSFVEQIFIYTSPVLTPLTPPPLS